MSQPPQRSRVILRGVSSRAWEHPADRGALVALRRLKGFDTVLKTMSGLIDERAYRLSFLGQGVRVDERQFPVLHRLLGEVGQVLDAAELPELFVVAEPRPNAMTIGMKTPFVVMTSGLVDLLAEDELRFVLGHELGHALSGHAVYRTLLQRLLGLSGLLSSLPLGGLGLRGLVAALLEWARKAELSADRAGLLATQDPAAALRAQMQLASGGHLEELDTTSFLDQGREYAETGDLRDSVLRLLMIERRSHPLPVMRAAELRRWVDSGEYTSHLAGGYPRREDDDDASVSEAAKQAAADYAQALANAQDVLGRTLHDLAGVVGSVRLWLDERLRRDG